MRDVQPQPLEQDGCPRFAEAYLGDDA
jgi:hypothetical protein